MSTPYNNEWVLGRSRRRVPPRQPQEGSEPQDPRATREPRGKGRPEQDGPRVLTGAPRKRPRWIDRDT